MAQKTDKPSGEGQPGRPHFSDVEIAKARSWFAKGQGLAEKKNYDYAIESYISGLNFWPEAVDEGHKPCRAAALFRGSKKASFTDGYKYKVTDKDPKKAMLNAEMLLSKDPGNVGYMEALFKNAARGGFDQTVMWIGELLADVAVREPKTTPERFVLLRKVYEELAGRNEQDKPELAIQAYERAVDALSKLHALKPNDMQISTELRDVAGKLTILKGRYSTADSFRDSVHDTAGQKELHDKERLFQSDERMVELVAAARKRYEADPTDRLAINELASALCRQEDVKSENEAIELLSEAAERTGEYRFKMRADDIRVRQLKRKREKAETSRDAEAFRKCKIDLLRFELNIFKERCKQYPTDLRMRFQYGLRLFQAGKYDDAIPILQEARSDPKARVHCNLYVGRCFFEKGYHSQAIETLQEAIRSYESPDDELGKEMHYRLGRAFEADGRVDDALKTYGQLIQWDYNYRNGEVRKRLDALKAGG
ncbi:MAG: tetratricopeptide repeat protein [Phycisphaerae bacterium]|nr:tetratricopeptide repeat protein [Phycisphaerae bacterium]